MLAAAAMNFKTMMNKWKLNPLLFSFRFFKAVFHLIKTQHENFLNPSYNKIESLRVDYVLWAR